MSGDFQVTGADDFLRLSKAMKAAGRTELRKALNKGMRQAATPMVEEVRAAFREEMPHGGGLGDFLAGKKIKPVTRTGKDPGVKIVVSKQDPRLETEGRLAHPVFNRRYKKGPKAGKRVYAVQKVKPGIVGDRVQKSAPIVRDALEHVLQDFADQIVRDARG